MGERRKLVEAVSSKPDATALEQEFVYTGKPKRAAPKQLTTAVQSVNRAPLTTRMRVDYANAVKHVSLQRQLDGIAPNTLQDILEEAVETWLRANGELPSD